MAGLATPPFKPLGGGRTTGAAPQLAPPAPPSSSTKRRPPLAPLNGRPAISAAAAITPVSERRKRPKATAAWPVAAPKVPEAGGVAVQSYEISPYKSDSDEEADEDADDGGGPRKPIPAWARREMLQPLLQEQLATDPDLIFSAVTTCDLIDVFGVRGSKKRGDFARRSSSGDWLADRLTWREELHYKRDMGYLD
eukprot:SM000102S09207  [mRNA]  locus=s102:208172:209019:- [translate_table: standard]